MPSNPYQGDSHLPIPPFMFPSARLGGCQAKRIQPKKGYDFPCKGWEEECRSSGHGCYTNVTRTWRPNVKELIAAEQRPGRCRAPDTRNVRVMTDTARDARAADKASELQRGVPKERTARTGGSCCSAMSTMHGDRANLRRH